MASDARGSCGMTVVSTTGNEFLIINTGERGWSEGVQGLGVEDAMRDVGENQVV